MRRRGAGLGRALGVGLSKLVLACATMQPAWAARLREAAVAHGWHPLCAADPQSLLSLVDEKQRGLVVCDWEPFDGAPGLARRWVAKARKEAPGFALVLAGSPAHFGAGLSRLLSAGADDLLERTLTGKSLAHRLLKQAKRCAPPAGAWLQAPGGGFRVDSSQGKLFISSRKHWKEAGPLSPKEMALLCCFLENPGVVLERSELLHRLWPGRADHINAETVGKHVEAVRRKLGRFGRLIVSVYGSGYKLV